MNDLQSYIDEQVAEINLDHSKKFNEEKKVLQPLHGRYEQVMIVPGRKVNKQALVRYLNVDYSVPDRLVGRKVDLRVYPNRISIYYEQEKVAEHERLYGGDKKNVLVKINYQHHTKIYLENPQGLPGSDMVDGNPELQEICGKYFTTKTKDGLPKIDCKGFARFLFLAGEAGIPVEELEDHVQDFLKEEFQSLKKEEKESSKDAAKVAKKSQDQIKKAQSSLFIGGGKKNDK